MSIRPMDEELRFRDFTTQTRETYRGHVQRFLRAAAGKSGEPPGTAEMRRYLLLRGRGQRTVFVQVG